MLISTIFEIALAITVIWCVFHEDKFISFEDKLKERFKRGE